MKKTTVNIERSPRNLTIDKKVCDIISEYLEIDTEVKFKIIDSETEGIKNSFTLLEFNKEEDGMTRKTFISSVKELMVHNYILNTGNKETYTDTETGQVKTRQEKLNEKTEVIMFI